MLDPATLSVKQAPKSTPPATPCFHAPGHPSGVAARDPALLRQAHPRDEHRVAPTASKTAKPVSGPVVDGTLNWGVKERFRKYVVGPIAHGKVETSEGATASGDGYRFGKATGRVDADKKTLNAAFQGKVRFLGHETAGEYELDLSLSNLKVDVKGTGGKLLADVSTKPRPTEADPKPKVKLLTGVPFADLKVPADALAAKDGIVNLKGVPATLTEEGSKAFSGMYLKGDQLDALNVAVSLDKDAQLPGGTDGGYENCAAAEAV